MARVRAHPQRRLRDLLQYFAGPLGVDAEGVQLGSRYRDLLLRKESGGTRAGLSHDIVDALDPPAQDGELIAPLGCLADRLAELLDLASHRVEGGHHDAGLGYRCASAASDAEEGLLEAGSDRDRRTLGVDPKLLEVRTGCLDRLRAVVGPADLDIDLDCAVSAHCSPLRAAKRREHVDHIGRHVVP